MVVVNDFDERLHFAALVLAGFRHAAGYGEGIAIDASYEGVREGMLFAAVVLRLDYDDFLACVAAAGYDGLVLCVRLWYCIALHLDGIVPLGQP